jgi:hypothetical protein
MKRSGFVRFQVLALLVLAGLLVWRATRGPELPEAAVSLAGLEVGELYSAGFSLGTAGRVRIDAAGSVESPEHPVPAAYAWLLGADRSVVWRSDTDSLPPDGTGYAVVDTILLEPGVYQAYFTTLGPTPESRSDRPFLGLKRHWTNDARSWHFLLSPVDSIRISGAEESRESPPDEAPIWTSGPTRNDSSVDTWLAVDSPTPIRVRAVAEICDPGCDEALIEDAVTGHTAWNLSAAESMPAGGSEKNRKFDGLVSLGAGIYRVQFVTNGSHAYGSWDANPPWDPEAWGMLIAGPKESVREFDPWETSEPYVSLLAVGNDQTRSVSIDVVRPVRVAVDAMGEIWDGGQKFDYAWIESEDRTRVWEMDPARTRPAGGDRTNRREVAFVDLQPGRYVVYYQTDGSHAYGDFTRLEPTHPERWGVALFPLEPLAADSSAVRVLEESPVIPPAVDPSEPLPVPSPIPPVAGETLFSAVGLGNDQEQTGEFVLSRTTRIRIIALGEIARQGRYDFGWIESENGDYVWEMTLGNTESAGGDDRNRRFDSVVPLPAGRYRAHFRTDFSHAFGDFGDGAPRDPSSWGMTIVRMPE